MSVDPNKKFCTVVNCMDGRVALQVKALLDTMGISAEFPDSPTIAGVVGRLSGRVTTPIEGNGMTLSNDHLLALLDWEIGISVNGHGSEVIAVAGHYDCAGNPGNLDIQKEDVLKSIEVLRALSGGKYAHVRFIGIVYNENFMPEVIYDSHAQQSAAA